MINSIHFLVFSLLIVLAALAVGCSGTQGGAGSSSNNIYPGDQPYVTPITEQQERVGLGTGKLNEKGTV